MSSTTKNHTGRTSANLTEKQNRILEYIIEQLDEQSFFKSRYMAEDLDLSAKEIGVNLGIISEKVGELDFEKWGKSSGTTWKITRLNRSKAH